MCGRGVRFCHLRSPAQLSNGLVLRLESIGVCRTLSRHGFIPCSQLLLVDLLQMCNCIACSVAHLHSIVLTLVAFIARSAVCNILHSVCLRLRCRSMACSPAGE